MNFIAIALTISATALESGDITSGTCPSGMASDCQTTGFQECITINESTGNQDDSGTGYCAASAVELGEGDDCLNSAGQLLGPCPTGTSCTITDSGIDSTATCVSTQVNVSSTDAPTAVISTDAGINTDTGSIDASTEALSTEFITTEPPGPTACTNGDKDSVCVDNEHCVVIDENGLATEVTSDGQTGMCLLESTQDGQCYDGSFFTGYCLDQLCIPDLDADTSTCRTAPTPCPNGDECDATETCQNTSGGSFTTAGEDSICLPTVNQTTDQCFDGYFYVGACLVGDLCVADPGTHTGSCQTPPPSCDADNLCVDTTVAPQLRAGSSEAVDSTAAVDASTVDASTVDASTVDASTDAYTTEASTLPSGPMCVSINGGFPTEVENGVCLSPAGLGEECNDGYFDIAYCASGLCARDSGVYTSTCKNAPTTCPNANECVDGESCVVINSDGSSSVQTETDNSGSGQCLVELGPGEQCFNGVFNDGFCGTDYICATSGDGTIGTCQSVGGSTEVPTEVRPEGPSDEPCTGRLDPYCANDCVTFNSDGSANYITEDEGVDGFCMPVAIGGETCTETTTDGALVYTHYCEEGLKCESVGSDQDYQCTGEIDSSITRIASGLFASTIAILLF